MFLKKALLSPYLMTNCRLLIFSLTIPLPPHLNDYVKASASKKHLSRTSSWDADQCQRSALNNFFSVSFSSASNSVFSVYPTDRSVIHLFRLTFQIAMELVGSTKRTICGIGFSIVFGIGVMLVAMYASFISDPTILQMVYALHACTIIGHWWLIDESIRWLWSQGRIADALVVLEKAAKLNRIKLDLGAPADDALANETGNVLPDELDAGIIPLLKTPIIRRRTIYVTFNWFANSLVFYGLSLNTGNLAGNPFLVLFLVGLAEIPGYFMATFLIDRLGRRSVCTSFMVLGGCFCIIAAFIIQGM